MSGFIHWHFSDFELAGCGQTPSVELANKSGSEKGHIGPSRHWSAYNYTDIYQAYFGRIRNQVKNFCEIGLGVPGPNWTSDIAHGSNEVGGGSMRMWQEFFPNAKIHGLDINPAKHLDNKQVTTYRVDQSSKESLAAFKSQTRKVKFDIIVDDGSHIADHQQLSLSLLWERLASGGYYVIEDLNDLRPGEARHTKHAPDKADSTRELFKRYLATSKMGTPHNFDNLEFLSEISYAAFHSFLCVIRPRDLLNETIRNLAGRGGKGMLRHEYRTASAKMLVLQKAG